jgi:acyl carrier protein
MTTTAGPESADGGHAWEPFATIVADAADVDLDRVSSSTRLIEDLNLDSLALFEVVASLLLDYGLEELPDDLQRGDWSGVTAGELYEQVRNLPPPGWSMRWS